MKIFFIPSLYEEIKNIFISQIHSISELENHVVLIENSHFTKDRRQYTVIARSTDSVLRFNEKTDMLVAY